MPDFQTQLWLMLALTLFQATALAWARATSTLPGILPTSTSKMKAELQDCLHSDSQCFTCTMLRLTAFQGGSTFPFRAVQLEPRIADNWWRYIRIWIWEMSSFMTTHPSPTSKSGDVANCSKLQVKTFTKPTKSPVMAATRKHKFSFLLHSESHSFTCTIYHCNALFGFSASFCSAETTGWW